MKNPLGPSFRAHGRQQMDGGAAAGLEILNSLPRVPRAPELHASIVILEYVDEWSLAARTESSQRSHQAIEVVMDPRYEGIDVGHAHSAPWARSTLRFRRRMRRTQVFPIDRRSAAPDVGCALDVHEKLWGRRNRRLQADRPRSPPPVLVLELKDMVRRGHFATAWVVAYAGGDRQFWPS